MTEVTGRRFLITGAASGIGAALAQRLGAAGNRVMLADINLPGATEVAAAIGQRAAALALDITSEAAWDAALRATDARFGGLDVLVNNAGIAAPGYARDVALAEHYRTINTNFMGPLTGILAALPRFKAQGHGHIVTVCSMTAFLPFPGIASYGASKHALRAFHHAVAMEEQDSPIVFTIVHPTATETPMLDQELANDSCGLAFVAPAVTADEVAAVIERAIAEKSIEIFMPPEQAEWIRVTGSDSPLLYEMYGAMAETGRANQLARRARL